VFDQTEGKSVTYRGFDLNDAGRNAAAGPTVGCLLERIDWPGLRGVGYVEKRARGDGADASDVYLPARRFMLRGKLYGATQADLYDRWNDLTEAFTPSAAYEDDSENQGYVPLAGTQPTDRTDDFSTGEKNIYINIRPVTSPSAVFDRDRTGGNVDQGHVLDWQVEVEAKDPRVYISEEIEAELGASGDLENRGNYKTPVTLTVTGTAGQTLRFVGLGCDLTITIEDSDGTVILDAGKQNVVQELGGQTTLRMDLVTFDAARLWPFVPAGGGSYTTSGSADGVATYHEAFI
jgi:hypothetical protein